MRHLSLFSGIGGIDLAAEWAGFHTVAFVEKDPFCQKVLAKHWPEVPIYDDVTTFQASNVPDAYRSQPSKERRDDGEVCRVPKAERESKLGPDLSRGSGAGIDLLSGGFPCQPFSVAGKRRAINDPRYLWREAARIIRDVRPRWVLLENVRGLLSAKNHIPLPRRYRKARGLRRLWPALEDVLRDLSEMGYRVGWGTYGACHVGAPHRRERIFIVAYSAGQQDRGREFGRMASNLRASGEEGYSDTRGGRKGTGTAQERTRPTNGSGWLPEPNVGRVANGVSRRVDRLRSLGNAVVPQQVYPILQAIADEIRREAA